MDSIRQAIEEAKPVEPVEPPPPPPPPPAEAKCQDLTGVEELLDRQRLQMVRMNKQLQALTAASPSFAASECPGEGANGGVLDGKTIIGESEWIYLSPPGHHYQARVDSGATTSSLSAMNITRFERNGEKWVRFWLQHDDESNPIEVEAPLVRHVRIRQASADDTDRRPVVSLTVNLGNNLQQSAEFSLTDRSQMTYPILLGREFLRDVTLIDVGRRFIHPKFVPDVPSKTDAAAKKAQDSGKKEPVPAAPKAGTSPVSE